MIKSSLKNILKFLGIDPWKVAFALSKWSVKHALREQKLLDLTRRIEAIVPDISNQYAVQLDSDYEKLKMRGQHAFQCSLMIRAIESLQKNSITVVDIGDSAGTHMLYLKGLFEEKLEINTVSVNLDPRAIEKIKSKGMNAILCRAEELDLGEKQVDLFTSFEMVEHLHNPAIFFRRLAKRSPGKKILITVPYLKTSRVGLYQIRHNLAGPMYAEDEHIFELSPQDWTLLLLHAGWKVVRSKTYYQYPRRWPGLSQLMASCWRHQDFEGFWGAILEKDTTLSDRYQDWDE